MAQDLRRKGASIEDAVGETGAQAKKAQMAADGADRLVEVLESKVEEMVRNNPQILERMTPEQREKFDGALGSIKKRMSER